MSPQYSWRMFIYLGWELRKQKKFDTTKNFGKKILTANQIQSHNIEPIMGASRT
jgi:hypothetical protein